MKHQFRDYVLDILQPHGPITARSMFGGYGIFYDGLIIGIIVENQLYFKVDKETQPDYESHGSHFFVYVGKTKTVQMSYMNVPDSILENKDELGTWIKKAYEVTCRYQRSKRPKKKRLSFCVTLS